DVLREIGAHEVPGLLVLNKVDRLNADERAALVSEYPDALLLSAHDPADVARLRETVVAFFERDMLEEELVVPYTKQGVVGEVHARTRVLSESYDEVGARFRVRAHAETLGRLRSLLER